MCHHTYLDISRKCCPSEFCEDYTVQWELVKENAVLASQHQINAFQYVEGHRWIYAANKFVFC